MFEYTLLVLSLTILFFTFRMVINPITVFFRIFFFFMISFSLITIICFGILNLFIDFTMDFIFSLSVLLTVAMFFITKIQPSRKLSAVLIIGILFFYFQQGFSYNTNHNTHRLPQQSKMNIENHWSSQKIDPTQTKTALTSVSQDGLPSGLHFHKMINDTIESLTNFVKNPVTNPYIMTAKDLFFEYIETLQTKENAKSFDEFLYDLMAKETKLFLEHRQIAMQSISHLTGNVVDLKNADKSWFKFSNALTVPHSFEVNSFGFHDSIVHPCPSVPSTWSKLEYEDKVCEYKDCEHPSTESHQIVIHGNNTHKLGSIFFQKKDAVSVYHAIITHCNSKLRIIIKDHQVHIPSNTTALLCSHQSCQFYKEGESLSGLHYLCPQFNATILEENTHLSLTVLNPEISSCTNLPLIKYLNPLLFLHCNKRVAIAFSLLISLLLAYSIVKFFHLTLFRSKQIVSFSRQILFPLIFIKAYLTSLNFNKLRLRRVRQDSESALESELEELNARANLASRNHKQRLLIAGLALSSFSGVQSLCTQSLAVMPTVREGGSEAGFLSTRISKNDEICLKLENGNGYQKFKISIESVSEEIQTVFSHVAYTGPVTFSQWDDGKGWDHCENDCSTEKAWFMCRRDGVFTATSRGLSFSTAYSLELYERTILNVMIKITDERLPSEPVLINLSQKWNQAFGFSGLVKGTSENECKREMAYLKDIHTNEMKVVPRGQFNHRGVFECSKFGLVQAVKFGKDTCQKASCVAKNFDPNDCGLRSDSYLGCDDNIDDRGHVKSLPFTCSSHTLVSKNGKFTSIPDDSVTYDLDLVLPWLPTPKSDKLSCKVTEIEQSGKAYLDSAIKLLVTTDVPSAPVSLEFEGSTYSCTSLDHHCTVLATGRNLKLDVSWTCGTTSGSSPANGEVDTSFDLADIVSKLIPAHAKVFGWDVDLSFLSHISDIFNISSTVVKYGVVILVALVILKVM